MGGGRHPARSARPQRRARRDAGFTLIETLLAAALFVIVVGALATITGQWLPAWHHGFGRVQRAEQLAFGVDRIVADLAAAQFITPNARIKRPIFDGSELSATLVRGAVGPNSQPGLEIVRYSEIASDRGPALVRATAPFVPLEPDAGAIAGLAFTTPVVVVRPPFRVTFAYAGPERLWQPTWRDAGKLPTAVRVTVRDAVSGETLAVSTAAKVHVEAPAECANKASSSCADQLDVLKVAPPAAAPAQGRTP